MKILNLLALAFVLQVASASEVKALQGDSGTFCGLETFKLIVADRINENVVFSPVSTGTCMGLAYFGAEGETAKEIRPSLGYPGLDDKQLSEKYGQFIKSAFGGSGGADAPALKIANRFYVNEGLEVAPAFNEIASNHFGAKAEQVKFAHAKEAVEKINTWVEEQTNHKIKGLLQPNAVDAGTSSVLVNAIYFKGKWKTPFVVQATRKEDFHNSPNSKVSVDTMQNDDTFRYIELPEMDAKAIELPYENSELSMIIVVPNKLDGLREVEKQCSGSKLAEIVSKMTEESVTVSLPKFRIEFDIDLSEPLSKLGIKKMFSDSAEFGKLFSAKTSHKVDKVQHKAYLDVNEAGSEAAAATFLKIVPLSLNLRQKKFKADRPFAFAIRDNNAVYFAGHVVKL